MTVQRRAAGKLDAGMLGAFPYYFVELPQLSAQIVRSLTQIIKDSLIHVLEVVRKMQLVLCFSKGSKRNIDKPR